MVIFQVPTKYFPQKQKLKKMLKFCHPFPLGISSGSCCLPPVLGTGDGCVVWAWETPQPPPTSQILWETESSVVLWPWLREGPREGSEHFREEPAAACFGKPGVNIECLPRLVGPTLKFLSRQGPRSYLSPPWKQETALLSKSNLILSGVVWHR